MFDFYNFCIDKILFEKAKIIFQLNYFHLKDFLLILINLLKLNYFLFVLFLKYLKNIHLFFL